MASLPIVEELEIVEQRGARQDPRGPRRVVEEFDLQRGERALDIRPSSLQMLKGLQHPYAQGQPVYDVTFENVQAGDRTSHLFRLANQHQALVVGTSDLSELALGCVPTALATR